MDPLQWAPFLLLTLAKLAAQSIIDESKPDILDNSDANWSSMKPKNLPPPPIEPTFKGVVPIIEFPAPPVVPLEPDITALVLNDDDDDINSIPKNRRSSKEVIEDDADSSDSASTVIVQPLDTLEADISEETTRGLDEILDDGEESASNHTKSFNTSKFIETMDDNGTTVLKNSSISITNMELVESKGDGEMSLVGGESDSGSSKLAFQTCIQTSLFVVLFQYTLF